MTKIGFNNLGFSHLPEAEAYAADGVLGWLQAASDFGFQGFQLTTNGPQRPEYFQELDTDALRRRSSDLGIKISVHHHAFDLCSFPHFVARDSYADEYRAYLQAAGEFLQAVDGHLVSFHPPQVNRKFWNEASFADPAARRRAIDAFGDMIRELGDFAAERGIRYAIEAICFGDPFPGGTAFRGFNELDEFVRAPGFPDTVGLLVDTNHFHYVGGDLLGALRSWSDKLLDIHASDCPVHKWVDAETYLELGVSQIHRPVGQGTVDFVGMAAILRDIDYDGWLTLELYPPNVTSLGDQVESRERLAAL